MSGERDHHAIAQLLAIASPPLLPPPDSTARVNPDRTDGLTELVHARNGFYAFEGALHLFPRGEPGSVITMGAWNAPSGWRSRYGPELDGHVFFAEDLFGGQFSIRDDAVFALDPETCRFTRIADDVEGWAEALLRDHRVMTGWPLGHDWQAAHGRLEDGSRLVPVIPFILGGAYDVDNLMAIPSSEAMRVYAETWRQTKDVPPGAHLRVHASGSPPAGG